MDVSKKNEDETVTVVVIGGRVIVAGVDVAHDGSLDPHYVGIYEVARRFAAPAGRGVRVSASDGSGVVTSLLVHPDATVTDVSQEPEAPHPKPAAAASGEQARPVGSPPAPINLFGAHGGAGVTTLVGLGELAGADLVDAAGRWPSSGGVVVVARTHARGLEAAQYVARAGAPDGVVIAGLVLVADAPGRLPKPLRLLAQLVSAAYSRVWTVPWCETCRARGAAEPVTCVAAKSVLSSINSSSNKGELP